MSFLTIDIGNTQIKVGKFHNNELVEKKSFQLLEAFYDYYCNQDVEQSILSSVRNTTWDSTVNPQPLILDLETKLPFKNSYQSLGTLGNDRKALVAGAINHYPKTNCLIIDAGTCITYDYVDSNQEYHGGAISPGFTMRYRALNQYTSKLPYLEYGNQEIPFLGEDTQSCMHSGVFHGVLSEIESFIGRYSEEKPNLKVLLTGGDAKYFEKHLKAAIFVHPNLQLEGLLHILQHND